MLELLQKPSNPNVQRSPFETFPAALEKEFREGWTDNADVMSYLYTGTPALKTDFTRTGKRTYKGAINDGINAVSRYYLNNFTDGHYHDCLDVCLQKLNPATTIFKPRPKLTSLKIYMALTLIATYCMRYFVTLHFLASIPEADQTWKHIFLYLFLVLGTLAAGVYFVVNNGRLHTDDATRYV